jgi:hypothetical protein
MNNYPFSCMVDLLLNCVHKWLNPADLVVSLIGVA